MNTFLLRHMPQSYLNTLHDEVCSGGHTSTISLSVTGIMVSWWTQWYAVITAVPANTAHIVSLVTALTGTLTLVLRHPGAVQT